MFTPSRFFTGIGSFALCCLVLLTSSARAEKIEWLTDFEVAKAKAKADDKLVFAFFTGSDWCVWCKKLQAEVLEKEDFQTPALKQYIFVELDYPQQKKLPEELAAQNQKLKNQYKIAGFPSVILMDGEGKQIVQTGYKAGGPEAYLKHLDGFLAIYKIVLQWQKEVEKLAGAERATLLDKIIDGYEQLNTQPDNLTAMRKEIIALDADGALKLKNKHAYSLLMGDAKELMRTEKDQEALVALDKLLALPDLPASAKFDIYQTKSMCFNGMEDYASTVAAMEKAIECDPENKGAKMLKAYIPRIKQFHAIKQQIDAAQAKVDKAEGTERAKYLVELFYAKYEMTAAKGFLPVAKHDVDPIFNEITKLDPDDTIHCRAEFLIQKDLIEAQRLINSKDPDDKDNGKELCEKAMAQPGITDLQKQEGYRALGSYYISMKETEEAVAMFKKALELAPKSARAEHIRGLLERFAPPANAKKADASDKEKTDTKKDDKKEAGK